MRPRVYISGPITKGDRLANVHRAQFAFRELLRYGFAPLNPIESTTLPFAWDGEFKHSDWLEADLPWVAVADAVLRLPGESVGADQETDFARERGIPVFHTLVDLVWAFVENAEPEKLL